MTAPPAFVPPPTIAPAPPTAAPLVSAPGGLHVLIPTVRGTLTVDPAVVRAGQSVTVRAAIMYADLPEWPPIDIDFGDESSHVTVAPTPLPPGSTPRAPVRRGSPVLVTSHTYAAGHEGLYYVRLYVAGKLAATQLVTVTQ